MFNKIFSSIISNGAFTGSEFAISTIVAIICGFIIAGTYMIKNRYTKSLVITLVLLPSIVELVIILVNGNIGTGVAVAGAFSLVRFRSAPGRGQEITSIFLAMAVGLATGMGYIGIAILFTVLVTIISLVLNLVNFGADKSGERTLRITVPENLDYEGRFEDLFEKYLKSFTYDEIKTSNMGSLYKLTLSVELKAGISTKEFLDEIRTRNGNLDISLGRMIDSMDSL
ncbi:MAG: DUF4956 domain-containing protein [Eubacterium sp.]|jgi:hypothetical protein|nr:DUF4956 domain-containing protein [Eubacterium sp.]